MASVSLSTTTKNNFKKLKPHHFKQPYWDTYIDSCVYTVQSMLRKKPLLAPMYFAIKSNVDFGVYEVQVNAP